MKKLLLFLAAASLAAASTVTVTVVSTTPQQAILNVVASDNSTCSIQVSQSATLTPLSYDVDESRFSGSSACNRASSLTSGNTYQMVIGKRATAQEAAGDIVSRSLQAYTTYYYKVTLSSGATASGSFVTGNPGLGNSAPDYIPFNSAGKDNYGWPSMHYSDVKQADVSIDPLTGFQTTRITGPGMMYSGADTTGTSPWIDNSGGGWSPCSALNKNPAGNYCTYTGAGGPGTGMFFKFGYVYPFLPSTYGSNYASLPSALSYALGDIKLTIDGHGDPLQACLTMDGSNCISSAVAVPLTSSDSEVNVPSNAPSPPFLGWGGAPIDPAKMAWLTGNITISGNVVTISGGQPVLPGYVKAGMYVFMLPDYTRYQIASIQDATHFTLAGTVPANDYNQYFLANWGVLMWKTAGGTGTTSLESLQVTHYHDESFGLGYDGNAAGVCNGSITLTTDGSGATVPAYTAKVCQAHSGLNNPVDYLWVPSTGEIRVFNESGIEPGWNFDGSHLQQCTYDNTYLSIGPGDYPVSNPDHYTCTTPNTEYTVLQEIQAAYGSTIDLNYWLDGGAIPAAKFRYRAVYGKNGHEYALFVLDGATGNADVSYWEFVLDLSLPPGPGQVISAHNSWSEYPTRWGVTHDADGPAVDWASGGTSHVDVFNGMGRDDKKNQNDPLAGEYVMHPSKVYNNTGGGTSLTNSFMASCSTLGVTDPRWTAFENPATGDSSCIKVNVPNEPVNLFPPTGAYQGYANGALTPLSSQSLAGSRQYPWPHNASSCGGDNTTSMCYGYLQPVAEGDWVELGTIDNGYPGNNQSYYIDGSGEIDIVGKKTVLGDGTIDLVLIRGLKDSFGNVTSATTQADGFYIQPMPALSTEFFFPLDEPFTFDNVGVQNPAVDGAHQVTWGLPDGSLIYQEAVVDVHARGLPQIREMNENSTAHGIRQGIYPETLKDSFQFAQPAQFPFDESFLSGKTENDSAPTIGNEQAPTLYVQEHPGSGGNANDANTSFTGIDFSPLGGASGGAVALWPQSATLVSGQSATYLVQNPQGNVPGNCNGSNNLCGFDGYGAIFMDQPDPKRRQTDYWAGPYLLDNISGPASVIDDSKPYTACYAYNAGECVSGSTAGQTFESVPNADLNGTCLVNDMTTTPCWTVSGPNQSWGYQYDVRDSDVWGKRWRRITMGYTAPGRQGNYDALLSDSTGEYLYANCYYCDNYRSDVLAVKVPPMPNGDSEQRNTFIPLKIDLPGVSGTSVRVRFGYAEYARGGSDNLFCSAERGEECATNVPTGDQDPYTWLSETTGVASWTACSSACTVNVPAIADRVVHYVIDRSDGNTTTSSTEQVAAIH